MLLKNFNWKSFALLIGVPVAVGVMVYMYLVNNVAQSTEEASYYQTMRVANNTKDFDFLLKTNAGRTGINNAEVKAKDKVSFPELKNEFMYIERIKENYRMHTTTYTTSDGKGHTQTHTKTYWTWDTVDREQKQAKYSTINDISVKTSDIDLKSKRLKITNKNTILDKLAKQSFFGFTSSPKVNKGESYIYVGNTTRYSYRYVPKEFVSTAFAELKNRHVNPLKNGHKIKLYDEPVRSVKNNFNEKAETASNKILLFTIGAILISVLIVALLEVWLMLMV